MEEPNLNSSDIPSIPFHFILSGKYRSLFLCIILLLIICGILIFIINVPLIIHARGVIRPEVELIPLISPLSSKITECRIRNGMYVKKNDTLLVFDQKWINKENEILTASKSLNENYLQDLKLLINNKKTGFTSDKYISEYEVYISGLKERETQKDRINKDLKRALSLYSDSLISEKEYEDIEQEYLALENTIHSYRSSQILKWKSESESYKNELLAISDRINKLKELSSQSVIISPVNGIIHEMKGLTSGTYINLHQHICNISPDTAYYAEVLINPPDIGWIYTGLKGRILLDSYGSNYWEAIETECIFISEEFSLFGDRPFFIARCSIDRFKPITRNGYYETIKKGMTLTVQFIITERTIFQLLTDKIDKWISLKNGIK